MATKNTAAAKLAATLAANSKAEKEQPKAAETDQAEREAAQPAAQPTVQAAEPKAKAKAPKAEKVCPPCACGCGELTGGGRFRPGHDARLHGRIKRFMEGRLDIATLSAGEAGAVEAAVAEGHIPGGSFVPQDHKSPEHKTAEANAKKRDALQARIARIEAELLAAQRELELLDGQKIEGNVTEEEHNEILAAMEAEGTA